MRWGAEYPARPNWTWLDRLLARFGLGGGSITLPLAMPSSVPAYGPVDELGDEPVDAVRWDDPGLGRDQFDDDDRPGPLTVIVIDSDDPTADPGYAEASSGSGPSGADADLAPPEPALPGRVYHLDQERRRRMAHRA